MAAAMNTYATRIWKPACPYTNDHSGHLVRGRDRQQDFGFSVGGPVWVPKVYNGRNKTFFFVNYEMFRHSEMRYSGLLNDPTDAMRNGDFSGLSRAGNSLPTTPDVTSWKARSTITSPIACRTTSRCATFSRATSFPRAAWIR